MPVRNEERKKFIKKTFSQSEHKSVLLLHSRYSHVLIFQTLFSINFLARAPFFFRFFRFVLIAIVASQCHI